MKNLQTELKKTFCERFLQMQKESCVQRRSFRDYLKDALESSPEDIEQTLFEGHTQKEFRQKYLGDMDK